MTLLHNVLQSRDKNNKNNKIQTLRTALQSFAVKNYLLNAELNDPILIIHWIERWTERGFGNWTMNWTWTAEIAEWLMLWVQEYLVIHNE